MHLVLSPLVLLTTRHLHGPIMVYPPPPSSNVKKRLAMPWAQLRCRLKRLKRLKREFSELDDLGR